MQHMYHLCEKVTAFLIITTGCVAFSIKELPTDVSGNIKLKSSLLHQCG